MAAKDLSPVISGAHVHVRIKLAVHGIDGSRQGDDLKVASEFIRVILLLAYAIDADGKMIRRAERADVRQQDMLCCRDLFHLFEDLLASVDPCHDLVSKSSVIHIGFSHFLRGPAHAAFLFAFLL